MIVIATQCFGPDFGGIEALMTGLADALAAARIEVKVFADRPHSRNSFVRPYDVRRFGGPRPLRGWTKRRAIEAAARGATTEGIFVDSWKSVAAVPEIAAPIVVLAHGMELPENASPFKARRIVKAFARAHTIVANSTYTATLARSFVRGERKPAVVVVPPPIPPQSDPTAAALADLDSVLKGRGPVLATVGRLEPRKGIDATLRALPAIRREFPDAVYFVAGGGEDLARLSALARSLGVAEATHFLGRLDEAHKAALLTRTDVFAMPARRESRSVEGYGIAYIEAAWRGKPAVAGRVGGASDAVIDGVTGLLCEGADDADVLATLLRLLRDEPLRKRLGAAAAARARGQLSWSAVLPNYRAALTL